MNRSIPPTTLKQLAADTLADLRLAHISEAQDRLSLLVQYCQDSQARADLEELRSNYNAMLAFLMQGGEDSGHSRLQADMARHTWALLIRTMRAIRLLKGDDHYCQAHARLAQNGDDAHSLIQRWSHTLPSAERLDVQDMIFDYLWTSPQWTSRDTTLWNDFILRQDALVQQHLTWAVFLSAWEFPDLEKVTTLTLMARSGLEASRLAAIAALVILYQQYGHDLEVLAAHTPDTSDQQMLHTALVAQQEFATILASRKDQEDENRELQSIKRQDVTQAVKQAFQIKLKYVRRRLTLGYDPNLGRMSLLHSSKFMSTCSHWFLPFDSTHPMVQSMAVEKDGTENQALMQLTEMSTDCDVDKYVMCELINNNAGLARSMTQHLQLAGLKDEAANPPKRPMKHAMQNLYRFFTHSPLARELRNPFASFDLLIAQERFRPDDSEDLCTSCAETLIDAREYAPAAHILDSIATQYGTDAHRLRLRGACHQHVQQWQEAIRCYTQATFLEEPDAKLLGQLYECCSQAGKQREAHTWLERWAEADPQDRALALRLADCHMQDRQYDRALKVLYRLDYDDPTDPQVSSRIARCQLQQAHLDAATKYVSRMSDSSQPISWETHMLTAHIKFAQGLWAAAKDFYTTAASGFTHDGQHTYSDFLKAYEADAPLLSANAVSQADMHLMRDALWMTLIHGA